MDIETLKTLYPDLIAQIQDEAIAGVDGDHVVTVKITRDSQTREMLTWTETTNDRLGLLICSKINTYSYDHGVLKVINEKCYDKLLLVSEQNLIHDGKNVTVEVVTVGGDGK